MTSTTVSHPLSARCWTRLSSLIERETAPHRRKMLADARGRVVEAGAGNGMNFRHYPATVDDVLAVEPESYLRARAQAAACEADMSLGTGEDDVAARALYVRLGFSNREANGALNFFYEREL